MVKVEKPVGCTNPSFQTSLFGKEDNFQLFRFQPTKAIIVPYVSKNKESNWNDQHVSQFNIVNEVGRTLAVKTIPVEYIWGAVETAKLPGVKLWNEVTTGRGAKKVQHTYFNSELKYTCKGGTITCLGLV